MKRSILQRLPISLALVVVIGLLLAGIVYAATHTDTLIWGYVENGSTSMLVRVCGTGPKEQIRAENVSPGAYWISQIFSYDWAINNSCTPDPPYGWRLVTGGQPGNQVRIFSLVVDNYLSEAEFMRQARRDSCTVTSLGNVSCNRIADYPFEVYNDKNYANNWCYSTAAGPDNVAASCNDQISSLILQSGWSVRLYRDGNQTGPSQCFTTSDSDLSDNTYDNGSIINETASSFALYQQANCTDVTPPDGLVTAPANGTTIGPGNVTFSANAWDNAGGSGVDRVEFHVGYNGGWYQVGTDYTAPYQIIWTTPAGLASQQLAFTIHVIDKAGNEKMDPGGYKLVNFVTGSPILQVSPASLSFSATAGGNNPAYKAFSITNSGTGTLNWTASDNAGWLSLSGTSGTAPSTVNAQVNINGLSAGTYNAQITVNSSGAVGSPKTVGVTLVVNPASPIHTSTNLRGSAENGFTTIWLQICGRGAYHRFRAEQIAPTSMVLGEWATGAINGCSSEYRTIIRAAPGDQFRLYSTVSDSLLSETAFLQQARRDSCTVMSTGVISCQPGNTPPSAPVNPPSTSKILPVPYVDQIYVQRAPYCYYDSNGNRPCFWTYCGPSSVAMLLSYKGKETRDVFTNRDATIDLVPKVMSNGQASWNMIRTYLREEKGFIVSDAGSYPTYEQIKQSIQRGYPALLGFLSPWNHVIIAVGYRDPNIIIVNDPMGGSYWDPGNINDSRRNDYPWVTNFPTPRTKGKNIEYIYGGGGIQAFAWAQITGNNTTPGYASTLVGSGGGVLVGNQVRVDVPAGTAGQVQAVAQTVTLSYTTQTGPAHSNTGSGLTIKSFRLESTDESNHSLSTFDRPFMLTVEINRSIIDLWGISNGSTPAQGTGIAATSSIETSSGDTPTLKLAFWNETRQQWIVIPATVDLENYRIVAQTDLLGEFMVYVQKEYQQIYLPVIVK